MKFGVVVFPGSNCDYDCYHVLKHVLRQETDFVWHKDRNVDPYDCMVLPGGFSYGDYLRTGAIARFSPVMESVIKHAGKGKLVIGICNGFQTLVKAGILPGHGLLPDDGEERYVTLTDNARRRFECRWVTLKAGKSPCIWTSGLTETLCCPIAHGEGRFVVKDAAHLDALGGKGLVAFTYVLPDGSPAEGRYPDNPNGSTADIAGICNPRGNVLGLMPHPEDNVLSGPGSRAYRGGRAGGGLDLFVNGVRYAKQL